MPGRLKVTHGARCTVARCVWARQRTSNVSSGSQRTLCTGPECPPFDQDKATSPCGPAQPSIPVRGPKACQCPSSARFGVVVNAYRSDSPREPCGSANPKPCGTSNRSAIHAKDCLTLLHQPYSAALTAVVPDWYGLIMLIDAHVHIDKYGPDLNERSREIRTHQVFTIAVAMDVPSYERSLKSATSVTWCCPHSGSIPGGLRNMWFV